LRTKGTTVATAAVIATTSTTAPCTTTTAKTTTTTTTYTTSTTTTTNITQTGFLNTVIYMLHTIQEKSNYNQNIEISSFIAYNVILIIINTE
jgi:type IV secretory pathway TrbL component